MKKKSLSSMIDAKKQKIAKKALLKIQDEEVFFEVRESDVMDTLDFIMKQHARLERRRDCSCNAYDLFREMFYAVYEGNDYGGLGFLFREENGRRNWYLVLFLIRELFMKMEYKDTKRKREKLKKINAMYGMALEVFPPDRLIIEKIHTVDNKTGRHVLRVSLSSIENLFEKEITVEDNE